jgi:hypothetical protein
MTAAPIDVTWSWPAITATSLSPPVTRVRVEFPQYWPAAGVRFSYTVGPLGPPVALGIEDYQCTDGHSICVLSVPRAATSVSAGGSKAIRTWRAPPSTADTDPDAEDPVVSYVVDADLPVLCAPLLDNDFGTGPASGTDPRAALSVRCDPVAVRGAPPGERACANCGSSSSEGANAPPVAGPSGSGPAYDLVSVFADAGEPGALVVFLPRGRVFELWEGLVMAPRGLATPEDSSRSDAMHATAAALARLSMNVHTWAPSPAVSSGHPCWIVWFPRAGPMEATAAAQPNPQTQDSPSRCHIVVEGGIGSMWGSPNVAVPTAPPPPNSYASGDGGRFCYTEGSYQVVLAAIEVCRAALSLMAAPGCVYFIQSLLFSHFFSTFFSMV